MNDVPRILVIGAGVNGSAIAANLFHGGVDVTVLARGQRFDELRDEGIVIENPFNRKRTVTRVPVIHSLEASDRYDFVLVVVRKNQVAELLPSLSRNTSPNIVFMGNNISGPGEFVQALGRERVMMGFVVAAGRREGSLIRAMVFKGVGTPCGELDGSITPRLKQLGAILHRGGFKMKFSRNIIDEQMTHGVGVAPIGMLVMQYGGDLRALARSRGDLITYVQARREGLELIRALGHQVLPSSEAVEVGAPVFIQMIVLRGMLNSKFGEVGLAWHVSQAPDEILQLANELKLLVEQAGLPAPATRKILAG